MTAAAIELAHLIVGYARISIVPWWILAPGTILALVGMIWGFDGLHNRQAPSRGYGTLGTTGYRIACAGITIGLLESLIRTLALLRTAFIAPGSFGERFLSFVVFSVGYTDINVAILLKSAALLVLSIGFMLWGLASLRAQVVPRWFCVLLGGYFFLLIPTYFVLTPEVVTVRVSPVLDAEIW